MLRHLQHAAPIVALALACLLTRPLSSDWPTAVTRMRSKEPDAAGTFASALKPVRRAWRSSNYTALSGIVLSRCALGTHVSEEDPRVWAFDALLLTVGCTHRRCYVGILGKWRAVPDAKYDLYALIAAHAAAVLLAYTDMGLYHRLCSPRLSAPHTLLTALFAASSPFELLWLVGSIMGLGPNLQRTIGRLGYLALYIGGSLSSVLLGAYVRHSVNGSGGALASCAYHALVAPHARHSVFGLEMGARMALAAQAGLASLPATHEGARSAVILALNGVPILVGAVVFWWTARWK